LRTGVIAAMVDPPFHLIAFARYAAANGTLGAAYTLNSVPAVGALPLRRSWAAVSRAEAVPSAEAREPGQLRRGSAETETGARSARIGDGGCGGSRASATRFSAAHDGAFGKCQPYGTVGGYWKPKGPRPPMSRPTLLHR
jgi:hypothetical protein